MKTLLILFLTSATAALACNGTNPVPQSPVGHYSAGSAEQKAPGKSPAPASRAPAEKKPAPKERASKPNPPGHLFM